MNLFNLYYQGEYIGLFYRKGLKYEWLADPAIFYSVFDPDVEVEEEEDRGWPNQPNTGQ